MNKYLVLLLALMSFSVYSAEPQFNDINKKDIEGISTEFGTNFAHTVVAAPETNGLWGAEFGLVGGKTSSSKFKNVIEQSGGDGGKFESIYHAGLLARAHFPFELIAEVSFLPGQEIGGVEIESNSFSIGWNVGRFVNLPLDVTVGYDHANGKISFKQDASGLVPEADIDFETTTKVIWAGISKTFLFVTPYFKVGTSSIDGDLKASADIFDVSGQTSESVSLSGGYLAAGANIQLLLFRFGVETTQMQNSQRISGKFSVAF